MLVANIVVACAQGSNILQLTVLFWVGSTELTFVTSQPSYRRPKHRLVRTIDDVGHVVSQYHTVGRLIYVSLYLTLYRPFFEVCAWIVLL